MIYFEIIPTYTFIQRFSYTVDETGSNAYGFNDLYVSIPKLVIILEH